MDHFSRLEQSDLEITTLGRCTIKSPLALSSTPGDHVGDFVHDDARMIFEPRFRASGQVNPLSLEHAGPRERIYFDPAQTKAAIVTCGGLCPGINNVIRTAVFELAYNYGVPEVLGIRFGFEGLNPAAGRSPIRLTPELVEDIHHKGGTILGTSRGPQDPKHTVDFLLSQGVNILLAVGGDGTQRGARAIAEEALRRKAPLAVVGVPKTIDNDVKFCFTTFGFATAVGEAETVIDRAHVEAKAVYNGVGLVKLMGREAGFIAASATLASGEANFCLIPELPLELEGPHGFLMKLRRRLAAREHAVVVVAEGAGQNLLQQEANRGADASGNRRLGDIGYYLKERIESFFKAQNTPVNVKYFDPSYYIRSLPAAAVDSLLCERFARAAVHAAMAGKTDMLVGLWHNHLVHVPLTASTGVKRRLNPESELWTSVLALTGQEKW
ncbi:MAG: ATP-dependent 6-phosphofructokinase [Planctomycetota bacterium]|nr:MAG: ATP-dependent 6-phosphofructokinase [Planctomycetota bacterium]